MHTLRREELVRVRKSKKFDNEKMSFSCVKAIVAYAKKTRCAVESIFCGEVEGSLKIENNAPA